MAKRHDRTRRRNLIRDRLYLAKKTQAQVARETGVSRQMVCQVIAGRKKHHGVQVALAGVCEMTFAELWDD